MYKNITILNFILAKFDILKRILLKYADDKRPFHTNIRLWIRSFVCVAISLDTKASHQQVKFILEWLQQDLFCYFSKEELLWIVQQFIKVIEFWIGVYQYAKALTWMELCMNFITIWKNNVISPQDTLELDSLYKELDSKYYQEILEQLG